MHIVLEQDVLLLAQSPVGKERSYKDLEALAVMFGIFNFEIVCRTYNSWVMEFHKRADLSTS